MEQTFSLHTPVLVVAGQPLSLGLLLAAGGILLVVILLVWRLARRGDGGDDERLAVLLSAQAEMQGRIAALADVFGTRQAEMNRNIGERLDGMSDRSAPRSANRPASPTTICAACRSGWR